MSGSAINSSNGCNKADDFSYFAFAFQTKNKKHLFNSFGIYKIATFKFAIRRSGDSGGAMDRGLRKEERRRRGRLTKTKKMERISKSGPPSLVVTFRLE
jgi:hypothetical protein